MLTASLPDSKPYALKYAIVAESILAAEHLYKCLNVLFDRLLTEYKESNKDKDALSKLDSIDENAFFKLLADSKGSKSS